ncbi:hypothetical protein PMIN06_000686 [Paraphaeosphaeria minitans]|uniref:NAD(P)-binding domain-containing protein n=1 Tax=Paraphaeosphaeria minitans TaxID=565426 RepID=A0A9P6GG72_9PLEO|nr:hypothetical protein PMIN01_07752 [Paraphaeosphaeria minitans]
MPTHVLLGATGSTGSAVLHYLLETRPQDLCLNIFVRNKEKLLAAFPQLLKASRPEIHIYTAPITDAETLTDCLRNAEVIYNCIAANTPARGMDIAQSAAASIINVLQNRQNEGQQPPPLLLMNRTMSLNTNVSHQMPPFVRAVVQFFLYHLYADVEKAADLYKQAAEAERPVLKYVYMDAPGLHDSDSMERTGHQLVLKQEVTSDGLNYADFGAAWVEAVERRSEVENRQVAVTATGHVRTQYWVLIRYNWQGLLARLIPW